MTTDPADQRQDDALSTRTFSPPAPVVLGTLVVGAVFMVVLEFLVIVSFVGQRLWLDPRLLRDLIFSLPFLMWLVIAAATVTGMLRTLTAWLQVDEHGYTLRSIARRTVAGDWSTVGRVIAVRNIDRGATPAELLTSSEKSYDGVYLLDRDGRRLLAVSSRFFGPRAQETTLRRAREAGVPIEDIAVITTEDLRRRAPEALSVADRHPTALVLLVMAVFLLHNVVTFSIWGL